MTAREQVKQLKRELEHCKSLNTFLNKKMEQQSEELKKVAKIKGTVAKLKAQIRTLENDNERLKSALLEYENPNSNVIDIQRRQMEQRINELEKSEIDFRAEQWKTRDKIAMLQYELDCSKKRLINLPPYGEIPEEFYEDYKSLEQQLYAAKNHAYIRDEYFRTMMQYCKDLDLQEKTEEYINNYFKKRRGARQKISDVKIETINKLRNGGMSIRDIAATVEVSVGSVHRYLQPKEDRE